MDEDVEPYDLQLPGCNSFIIKNVGQILIYCQEGWRSSEDHYYQPDT